MLRVCRDFTIAYVLAVLVLIAIGFLIEYLFQYDIGNAANIVPAMVGAMYAGQRYGTRTGTAPPSSFSWAAAFWMLVISIALSFVAIGIFAVLLGMEFVDAILEIFSQLPALWIGIIVAVILLVYFLIPRYFFSWGARKASETSQKELTNRF